MVSLDEYDPAVVDKAFWLQQKIYEDGLYPVGFMKMARKRTERTAAPVVARSIGRRLR